MANRKPPASPAPGGKGKAAAEPVATAAARSALMPKARPAAKPAPRSTTKPAAKVAGKAPAVAGKAAGGRAPKAKRTPEGGARRSEAGVGAATRYRMICEAAYYIAERRAFIGGDPAADWFEAERQVDDMLSGQPSPRSLAPPED